MAKSFAWSYSKMKNFETCPKRHYEVDLAKNYVDDTDQMVWGNQVHAALSAAALHKAGLPASGTGRDRTEPAPLPDSMKDYRKWVHAYAQPGLGDLKVELKYAITRDFQATSWFAGNVWMRGICDLQLTNGAKALAVDWKTGKILHNPKQLMLMAQCIFAHQPTVQTIHTEFVWLKDDCTTQETFQRDTIAKEWPSVLDTVRQMEQAAQTMTYPPKPGRLCARYCPVVSCPFHGKRHS